ncbi:MAG TPA: RsmE family RNA methyltransferase [Terriglobales bacterium]|nr:RsmE family RNA methyltransferase [Terriglobales bacterium]
MTRRRWIADEVQGERAVLLGQNAHHLSRVLRAKVGQEFDIACGDQVRLGMVTSIADDRVEFTLGAALQQAQQSDVRLLLAVFKFDRMEWAIEKAVELGVNSIHPVIARRTDAHLAAAAGKRTDRWRRIAHEAAQQSRRTSTPEIAEPVKLKDALQQEDVAKILLSEAEDGNSLTNVLAAAGNAPLVLAIGPEGGWAEDELQQFASAGWESASLGATILRAETAAIAAVALAMAFPQK